MNKIKPYSEMLESSKNSKRIFEQAMAVAYDPVTFKEVDKSYIIKCLDNKWRKVYAHNFITIEDLREFKLKELGI
jgi:hypothetical protein